MVITIHPDCDDLREFCDVNEWPLDDGLMLALESLSREDFERLVKGCDDDEVAAGWMECWSENDFRMDDVG